MPETENQTGRRLRVSVYYAMPDRHWHRILEIDPPATVADAIARSGLREWVPDLDYSADRLAVFGKKVSEETPLRNGDRVEILRALVCDPKEVRRQMALKQKED